MLTALRMRPVILLALVLAPVALGQTDARVVFLAKQLTNFQSDPRVRVNAAAVLGSTKSKQAVAPLCGALKADPEAIVRTAAAAALAELREVSAIPCLKEKKVAEKDKDVQFAVFKALEILEGGGGPAHGSLYVAIDRIEDKTGSLPPEVIQMAEELLRSRLQAIGATVASPNADRAAAVALIKQRGLRPYLIKPKFSESGGGLKVDLLGMTYPEQLLRGQISVSAKGGKPPTLVKAMMPAAVDKLAIALEWNP